MVKLAIWNSDYISVQRTLACEACQPRGPGGMPPPRKFLKIRPSKGESESIFSSKIMEFRFIIYHSNFIFPLNQD